MRTTRSPLSHDAQLVKQARHVARLERKARGLRAELKAVNNELRTQKRNLKIYAQTISDHKFVPPLREFGERGGFQS